MGDVFYHFKMIIIVQITHMDEHDNTHKDTRQSTCKNA